MPDGGERPGIRVLDSIRGVTAAEWDLCAGTDNPFVRHAFLSCLEESGSAVAETGWRPCHLVATDAEGSVTACAPLYLKSHSYGEYVFDWSWADAYQRAGGRYYPKLQCSVPFTPVNGPRLLVRPEGGGAAELAQAMLRLAADNGLSSAHATFVADQEMAAFEMAGFMRRLGYQYHWPNRGYVSFDDFLGALSSRRRKQVRKEREAVARSGLRLTTLVGSEVTPRHWDAFFRMVHATSSRKWGRPYLTRAFFEALSASPLGRDVVLMWAESAGQPVAAAFNMMGGGRLYGRTWGALADIPFLHFEMCYYRAIDFALERGLTVVEAGAQGEHKLGRGYLPVATHSAHWIADPALREPVRRFLAHETPLVAEDMAEQDQAGPYRRGDV
jgi:predicted N-acyltransferase